MLHDMRVLEIRVCGPSHHSQFYAHPSSYACSSACNLTVHMVSESIHKAFLVESVSDNVAADISSASSFPALAQWYTCMLRHHCCSLSRCKQPSDALQCIMRAGSRGEACHPLH